MYMDFFPPPPVILLYLFYIYFFPASFTLFYHSCLQESPWDLVSISSRISSCSARVAHATLISDYFFVFFPTSPPPPPLERLLNQNNSFVCISRIGSFWVFHTRSTWFCVSKYPIWTNLSMDSINQSIDQWSDGQSVSWLRVPYKSRYDNKHAPSA